MLVKRLERMNLDAFAHEEATRSLERFVRGVMIERYGWGPHNADTIESRTDGVLDFIRCYIANAPELLISMLDAAGALGESDDLTTIYVAVDNYLARAIDFIPEHLGLAGVTDDAYIVQSLLQRVWDTHASHIGSRLLSIDLAPANQLMRRIIGEPVATALDATVREILGLKDVQIAHERMKSRVVSLKLRMPDPYVGKLLAGDDLDVRLGTLGVRAA